MKTKGRKDFSRSVSPTPNKDPDVMEFVHRQDEVDIMFKTLQN